MATCAVVEEFAPTDGDEIALTVTGGTDTNVLVETTETTKRVSRDRNKDDDIVPP
jgi:hypothetical protein